MARFKLMSHAILQLRLDELTALMNLEFAEKYTFLNAVASLIGDERLMKQKKHILTLSTITHVVGFSGGITSSSMSEMVLKQYPETTVLLYHSTHTEPLDNDRFRQDVAGYLNHPITEDSDGRDIWQIFHDEGYLGNRRNTMCSRILKQERSLTYLLAHQPAILYIGFTVDEYNRVQRVYARYQKYGIEVKFPLIEQRIGKDACFQRVTKCWGLTPPQMYTWCKHANCIPCIKGKKEYFGLLYLYERAAWERTAKAEEEYGHTIFTEAGSLRDELPSCLRLAERWLKRNDAEQRQGSLFELPCECGG